MTILKRALLSSALALLAAAVLVIPAQAHSSLVSSNPSQGQVLSDVPAQLEMTFSSPMRAPAFVVATAPDGTALVQDEPTVDGATIRVALAPTEQRGTYSFAFRAVATDGHQVTGQIVFAVGTAVSTAPTPSGASSGSGSGSTTGGTTSDRAETAAAGTPADGFWSRHWWQVLVAGLLFAGSAALGWASRAQTGTARASS